MSKTDIKDAIKVRVRNLTKTREDGTTSRSISAFFSSEDVAKLVKALAGKSNAKDGVHVYLNEGASKYNTDTTFTGLVNIKEHTPPIGARAKTTVNKANTGNKLLAE